MRTQKCPLCLETKDVVFSHLIPAAVYGYCRTEDASPIRVGNGVIIPTDRQTQAYLLCRECEDILNKGGESWTIPKLATAQLTFPLYDLVVGGPPAFEEEGEAIYFAAQNRLVDVQRISHFAMGIFWKAAVHSWSGRKREPLIELGPYSHTIRTWLRGEADFPRGICLTITVSRPESALITLNAPVESKFRPWRTFLLHVPGVLFSLSVGKRIEMEMKMTCLHQNPAHPIFVSDQIIEKFKGHLGKHYRESRKTARYLNARAKRERTC